jgi:hypothetical protein
MERRGQRLQPLRRAPVGLVLPGSGLLPGVRAARGSA